MEDDRFIEPVEEFGAEMGPQGFIDPPLHFSVAGWITGEIENRSAADVAGENQDRVGEIHRATLAIGDATVIKDLQHDIEDIGVGLLHLIKEDHRVGTAPHRFGELAAFLVAHIARRRSDQAADGVLLHVFAHVDAHHRLLAVKQLGGQGFGKLGLAHTGGAQEQEGGNRPIRIGQPRPGALDGIGHRCDRLLLTNHPRMQFVFEMEQFLHLRLHQLAHRNARPLGDNFGDIILSYLFP